MTKLPTVVASATRTRRSGRSWPDDIRRSQVGVIQKHVLSVPPQERIICHFLPESSIIGQPRLGVEHASVASNNTLVSQQLRNEMGPKLDEHCNKYIPSAEPLSKRRNLPAAVRTFLKGDNGHIILIMLS